MSFVEIEARRMEVPSHFYEYTYVDSVATSDETPTELGAFEIYSGIAGWLKLIYNVTNLDSLALPVCQTMCGEIFVTYARGNSGFNLVSNEEEETHLETRQSNLPGANIELVPDGDYLKIIGTGIASTVIDWNMTVILNRTP